MDKKIVIILLFLFIVLPTISAVPPVTTVVSTNANIQIVTMPFEYIKTNTDLFLRWWAYNSSSGSIMTNKSVYCTVNFLEPEGKNILRAYVQKEFGIAGNTNACQNCFWYNINGTNLTKTGLYGLQLRCQTYDNFTLGGSTMIPISVNNAGEEFSEAKAFLYGSLFLVFIFFMISLLFFINKLPESNTKDEEGKILSINYLKYLRQALWFVEWMLFITILYLSSNIAFFYLGEQLFAKIMFTLFRIAFGVTPVIVVVWFIWMIVKMFHDKQLQNMINRGIFPQGKL